MINSRKLSDLTPEVAAKCQEFLDACTAQGLGVLITSTFRDIECQDALYAQGRTTPGKCITKARGGHSMHNYRVAFDWVPIDNHGAPIWNDDALWDRIGAIGESVGLEWGGHFESFTDKPHFQMTGGKSIQEFLTE